MVSSVISWTLFFGCLEFEGVRISIWCWGLRPLLQVGEIPESNTCLEKKICILFGFDANKLHPSYWAGSRRVGSDLSMHRGKYRSLGQRSCSDDWSGLHVFRRPSSYFNSHRLSRNFLV